MQSRGFEYHRNSVPPPSVFGNERPPETANSEVLARMSAEQRSAWNTALLGQKPGSGNESASVATFEVNGAVLQVDLNSCAAKGRAAVVGDEVQWMTTLIEAQQALNDKSGAESPVVNRFNELQLKAFERSQVILDQS